MDSQHHRNGGAHMAELKSLTLNESKYDSFVDRTARSAIETLTENLPDSGFSAEEVRQILADYLEEHPIPSTGGLSSVAAALLIDILQSAAYSTDVSQKIERLQAALVSDGSSTETPEVVTYTITTALTNVTTDSTASTVTAGAGYTAVLSPAEGYRLDSVTVTMGGVDITAAAYSDGVVTIAAVTGDVVITAVAAEAAQTGIVMAPGSYAIPAKTLVNYTDNGTTLGTSISEEIGVDRYVLSSDVFDAGTKVSISITPTSTAQTYVYCAAFVTQWDGASELALNNKAEVFYHTQFKKGWVSGGATSVYEYVIPAGYRLLVWSAGCNATVENIGLADAAMAPLEPVEMFAPIKPADGSAQAWYSDNGESAFGDGVTSAIMASRETFEADTTVVVTFSISGNGNTWDSTRIASEQSWSGLSAPTADDPITACYTEAAGAANGWAGEIRRNYTYTVRAGSRLLIACPCVNSNKVDFIDQIQTSVMAKKQGVV